MQIGALTVTGEGKTQLPLRGWPREVFVYFKPSKDPVPCDYHHHHHTNHDHLSYHIKHEDEDPRYHRKHEDEDPRYHRKHGHRHQERRFYLEIKWKVVGVREIDWFVFY